MSITQETRREAYESVDLTMMEGKVLDILLRYGPQSAEEIMARLGTRNPNNVRPRLTGLKKKGLARAVDKRSNQNGRSEAVWEATEKRAAPGMAVPKSGKGKLTDCNIAEEKKNVKL